MSSPLVLSSLDALAPPFYPSMTWAIADADACDTDLYAPYEYVDRPPSPAKTDAEAVHDVPDEALFDPALFPLSATEMQELAQVDEVNAILAELELRESHAELQWPRSATTPVGGHGVDADVDAEMYRWMAATVDSERCAQSTRPQSRSVK